MQWFVFAPSFEIIAPIFIFVFGLLIGSFLNVVVYRYNSGMTLGGRSMCFSCGKTLRWYELFPFFSFIAQRGRCRGCGAKISWQYPLVELLTGALFVGALYVSDTPLHYAYLAVQFSLLVVIGVYDLRHKIIPDLFSYLFAFLALAYIVWSGISNGGNFGALWQDLIAGPVYFLPFAALWYFSKGKWMGFGDAKLALGIGWFLGMGKAYVAMIVSFWTGSLVGIFFIALSTVLAGHFSSKKITLKSEIPFGPFLIFGLLIVTLCETYIMSLARLVMGF